MLQPAAAAAQPGKAADMLKMTRTQSPSPKASGSKSGARLASVSLLSEGSSRKRQKASVSPTHRSFGSSGMDSLAAAAAAMEAATAEEPTASGAADQTGVLPRFMQTLCNGSKAHL